MRAPVASACGVFDLATARQAIDDAQELGGRIPRPEPGRAEMLYLKGRIVTSQNELDLALASFEAALAEATEPKLRAEILEARGDVQDRQGNYPLAFSTYQAALEELRDALPSDRAPLISKLGLIRYRQAEFEEAIALAKAIGFAHSLIGLCNWRRGNYESAIAAQTTAMEWREKAKDLLGVANSSTGLANLYSNSREMELAERFYRKALEAYDRIGDAYWTSICLNNLAAHRIAMGHQETAEADLREALRLLSDLDAKQMRGGVLLNLGDALAKQGKHAEALGPMHEALTLFEAIGSREVFRGLADVYLNLHQASQCNEHLEAALRDAQKFGDQLTPGIVARLGAELASRQGQPEVALEKARAAIALLARSDAPLELARGRCSRG